MGQVLPQENISQEKPFSEKMMNYMTNSADEAVKNLLNIPSYDTNYDYLGSSVGQSNGMEDYDPEAFRKDARKEALKRLGKDGILLLLTYSNHLPKLKRFLTPRTLIITGAVGLALSAYPIASYVLKNRQRASKIGIIQGSPLSPLLSNIYLHEFDKAMLKDGFNLVRFADDWVIMCPNESIANEALESARNRLGTLRLRLHPEKTKILYFDDGFKFLGHNFGKFQSDKTQPRNSSGDQDSANTKSKIHNISSKLGEFAPKVVKKTQNLTKTGVQKLSTLIGSLKKGKEE